MSSSASPPDLNGRTARPRAAVTGASSGIGAAFARRLAAEGFDLVMVARREERLRALAGQLLRDHGAGVEVLRADLGSRDDLARVEERLSSEPLDLLVNNAGAAGFKPFAALRPDEAEELIVVHVTATTRLTRAVLPRMVDRGVGRIVNIASLLAFSESIPPDPLPYRAVYAGSKAFVTSFSQTLHHELRGTGVRVQTCCPGVVATEFHEVAGIDRSSSPFAPMDPDDVVTASLAALELDEPLCLPGLEDAALVERYHRHQRELLSAANHDRLASRYTCRAPTSSRRSSRPTGTTD